MLFKELQILLKTFFDRHTPVGAQLAIVGALLYGASPLDLIPDVIPLLGELDDLTVAIIVIVYFPILALTTSQYRSPARRRLWV